MAEHMTAERMSYGSEAICVRADGKTVFVPGAAVGDIVNVEIVEEKPSFARGRILEVLEAGSNRVAPMCKYAALCKSGKAGAGQDTAACPTAASAPKSCGGCSWAHLTYATQLSAKRANVVAALVRTAHIDTARAEELVRACVPSKREWGYRNKIELFSTYNEKGAFDLGFMEEGSHNFVAVDSCLAAHKPIQKTPSALRGALRFAQGSKNLEIYRVGVRASLRTGALEVALWTPPSPFPRNHVAKLIESATGATSVVRVVASPGKERKVKSIERLSGKGYWEEEFVGLNLGDKQPVHFSAGTPDTAQSPNTSNPAQPPNMPNPTQTPNTPNPIRFRASAPSFFQVNTPQAEKLVACVLDALGGPQTLSGAYVADLYAGVGTFSIPLALAGADVVAVEFAGSSVRDLRHNAEYNGVDIEVVGGDAARELSALGSLDALVVDPPRSGLAKGVPQSIAAAGPERVVYVSCNPATLARDIASFQTCGYEPISLTPYDMFPQTHHVETVVLMSRVQK